MKPIETDISYIVPTQQLSIHFHWSSKIIAPVVLYHHHFSIILVIVGTSSRLDYARNTCRYNTNGQNQACINLKVAMLRNHGFNLLNPLKYNLINIKCGFFLYLLYFFFSLAIHQHNDIPVRSHFMVNFRNRSISSEPSNLRVPTSSTCHEMLSEWSLYLTELMVKDE